MSVEGSMVGRAAVVTGAAGGIGAEFVRGLVAAGASVTAVDVAEDRLGLLATEFPTVSTVTADISTSKGADRALVDVLDRVDILCNIAGVGDGLRGIDEVDDEEWDRVMSINVGGAFRLCHRVVPLMGQRGGGVIINLASAAALRGGRAGAAYTASKWALVGLSQNIASSHGPQGVRCHAICPSAITGSVALTSGDVSDVGKSRVRRDRAKPPAGRPADVVALAMFLMSDEARHLNGTALPVDGGWLAF